MKQIKLVDSNNYEIAVLIKSTAFKTNEIKDNYLIKLNSIGFTIAVDLLYQDGKITADIAHKYINTLLLKLNELKVKYLYVADNNYFKYLTKRVKIEYCYGNIYPCAIKGYEHIKCVLGINYQQLIFNPSLLSKLDQGINSIKQDKAGTYSTIGSNIIHSGIYPEGYKTIQEALNHLHQYQSLACDIEAFSLRFWDAGIATIAFAWDQHNGICFEVDDIKTKKPKQSTRYLLKKFFTEYKGNLKFQKANYDLKVLIYNLWMQSSLDYVGMLTGLDILCRDLDDTLIISYLATNSTAGNKLSLKEQAQEFAGDYAVDVKDVTKVDKADLLKYNLIDGLSTWYVFNKNWPIVVKDNQEKIYRELLIPGLKVLIQTELVGMPMKDDRIKELRNKLEAHKEAALVVINNAPEIAEVTKLIQIDAMVKANSKLKTKQHPLSKFSDIQFNPNSGPQLQKLIYEVMQLPVINFTDSGLPATDGDTLKALINHCKPNQKQLLQAFNDYADAEKILNTFVTAFEAGLLKADGNRYLHGNFNIGGTVSGRLSSSDP